VTEYLSHDEAFRQFDEFRAEVDKRMLITYHCKSRGRLLVAVWSSILDAKWDDYKRDRGHLLYWQAPYSIPRHLNRIESTPLGRLNNSTNSDNRWPARAGDLDLLAADDLQRARIEARCQHVLEQPHAHLLVEEARRSTPTRRAQHRI
jgi:hypothetical protein